MSLPYAESVTALVNSVSNRRSSVLRTSNLITKKLPSRQLYKFNIQFSNFLRHLVDVPGEPRFVAGGGIFMDDSLVNCFVDQ